jgi:hypothetical protein
MAIRLRCDDDKTYVALKTESDTLRRFAVLQCKFMAYCEGKIIGLPKKVSLLYVFKSTALYSAINSISRI